MNRMISTVQNGVHISNCYLEYKHRLFFISFPPEIVDQPAEKSEKSYLDCPLATDGNILAFEINRTLNRSY